MDSNSARNKAGFTLIELMVTLAIVVIIIAGVYAAYINMYKSQLSSEIKAELQQNARNTLETITRELMMAGYYGEVYVNSPSEVQFSEILPGESSAKRIRYYKFDNKLWRQISDADGTNVQAATVLAENVTGLAFAYKDVNFGNMSSSIDEDYHKGIRQITVQVTMESSKEDPTTGQKATTVLKATIYPANVAEGGVALDDEPPATPTGFQVIDNRDCNSLELKWTKNEEPDIAGYYIMYGTQAGIYTGVISVPISLGGFSKEAPEYKLTGLIPTMHADRLTAPTKYYITLSAYDSSMNYSSPTYEVSGPPDLNTDVTTFGGGNDTVLNPKKPAPPTGFAVYNMNDTIPGGYTCGENQVRLVWSKSADATVGYRLYRSESPFTSFPIPATYLIADEVPTYVTKLDANTVTYLDTLTVSCKSYYYAICSINCDNTLIYGGGSQPALYDATDYALSDNVAKDVTGPPDPDLGGSKGGWKRVFINLVNPVTSASPPATSTPDFAYTMLYFSDLSMPVLNADGSVTLGQVVYDSSPEPGTPGEFTDIGSSALNSFVFNSDTRNLDNYATPELVNDHTYYFLAVAFDKCGNHSSGSATAKTLATLCGDDPAGAPPTPTGVTVDGCGDTMIVNWGWPTGAFTTWLDLQGFHVFRSEDGNFTGTTDYNTGAPAGTTALTGAPLWDVTLTDANNIQDGLKYYYCVRAMDCIWVNIPDTDERYASIKPNNITPCDSSSIAGPIYPGRIRRYKSDITDNPPAAAGDQYNFVTSLGVDPSTFPGTLTTTDYHNAVKFYIQNTSAGNVELNKISLSWSYATYLKAIRIGGSPGTTTATDYVFSTPVSSAEASGGKTITVALNEISSKASGKGVFSSAIPVLLIFTDLDGGVTSNTDMRQDQISVQVQYTNLSTGKSDCLASMDPPVNVPQGPTMFNSALNVPNYVGFDVPGNVTPAHKVTDVHPLATGGTSVQPKANINDTETYTYNSTTANVGIKAATVYFAVTDQGATSPSGATFTALNGVKGTAPSPMTDNTCYFQDNEITARIAPQDGNRVWYYFTVESYSGNKVRYPEVQYGYYMYDQGVFDACTVTPMAPSNLTYTYLSQAKLYWDQVYWYTDGSGINPTDSLTYQVYKKSGYTGSWALLADNLAHPGVTGYTDPNPLNEPTFYKVYAKNICADPAKGKSAASNTVVICTGSGSGCAVVVSPSTVTLKTDWSGSGSSDKVEVDLAAYLCGRANDGSVWNPADANGYDSASDITLTITSAAGAETQNVTLYEVGGDSGIFKRLQSPMTDYITQATTYICGYSGTYGSASDPNMYTQGATTNTSLNDTLTFTLDTGLTGCSQESTTVTVKTDPCNPTRSKPGAPTGLYISSMSTTSGNWDYTLSWFAPAGNADGSVPASVGGYYVYYNDDKAHPSPNRQWDKKWTVTSGTTITINGLPRLHTGVTDYDYSFYVTTYDACASGPQEGAASDIVSGHP